MGSLSHKTCRELCLLHVHKNQDIMNETTYKNTAMFKEQCKGCGRPIYPGETIVTTYHDNDGVNINVLEAHKLPTKEVSFTYHCARCKN